MGDDPLGTAWLLSSWVCWGLSITAIVASFLASTLAIRKALDQVDAQTIYAHAPRGVFSKLVALLNASGGLLFLAGSLLIVRFVGINL